jgi:hypothetical protein
MSAETVTQLQRKYGNQAVQRMIAERGEAPVQRTVETPVQRNGEAGTATATAETGPAVTEAVNAAVGGLPDIDGESVPTREELARGEAQGAAIRAEVAEVAGSNPAAQAFVVSEMTESAEVQSEEGPGSASTASQEASVPGGSGTPAPAPTPAPTPEATPESAPTSEAPTETGNASKVFDAKSRGEIQGHLKLTKTIVGKAKSTMSPITKAVTDAGDSARTIVSTVGTAVGVFFSALQAMLDVRAAISSGFKYKALGEIKAKMKAAGGYDDTVLDAIEYAMDQKYKKAIMRAVGFIGGAISMSVGIAVLAGAGVVALVSNPAGWGVLTALAAVGAIIGLSLALYKFGRWIYKRFISGDVRQKRHGFAVKLYQKGVLGSNEHAVAALQALGLNPADLRAAAMVARGKAETADEAKTRKARLDTISKNIATLDRKIAKYSRLKEQQLKLADTQSPSLKARHSASAAAYDTKVKEYQGKKKLNEGEATWKAIPKKERGVVKMIFKKLGK